MPPLWPLSCRYHWQYGGFEDDPAYKAQVVAAHPHCDFRWQGFVATEVLQQQLGRCRVLLMTPRWQEAFGNGVVEAMACGVPVAAYRRGGPGETIDHGVTGVLVEPDDVPRLGPDGAAGHGAGPPTCT